MAARRQRALLLAACLCGGFALHCGASPAPTFATSSVLPEGPRRPGGVAVDRVPEPTPATAVASSTARFVALHPPLGDDVALRLVQRFFEAVVAEDTAALATLVTSGTTIHDLTPAAGRVQQAALQQWRSRFRKHDYLRLTTSALFRPGDAHTYRGRDTEALPEEVRAAASGGDGDPSQVLVVRVPILSPIVDNERLFGDEVYFWMERRGDGYQIVKLAEDVPF